MGRGAFGVADWSGSGRRDVVKHRQDRQDRQDRTGPTDRIGAGSNLRAGAGSDLRAGGGSNLRAGGGSGRLALSRKSRSRWYLTARASTNSPVSSSLRPSSCRLLSCSAASEMTASIHNSPNESSISSNGSSRGCDPPTRSSAARASGKWRARARATEKWLRLYGEYARA